MEETKIYRKVDGFSRYKIYEDGQIWDTLKEIFTPTVPMVTFYRIRE